MQKLKPFLTLPFKKKKYEIAEGWIYSKKEQAIHGAKKHFALDFKLPRETEILAASSGWAISSYWRFLVRDEKGELRLFQKKPVGMGLGFFVQIYHPKANCFTQYAHLEKIASNIPFNTPRKFKDGKFISVGHKIDRPRLAHYKKAVWVEQGNLIGFVGDSGLTWGYEDYPKRPDLKRFPSWDEVHLHFEVFNRNKYGLKTDWRDPYDIWKTYQYYPWPSHPKPMGKNHLWTRII